MYVFYNYIWLNVGLLWTTFNPRKNQKVTYLALAPLAPLDSTHWNPSDRSIWKSSQSELRKWCYKKNKYHSSYMCCIFFQMLMVIYSGPKSDYVSFLSLAVHVYHFHSSPPHSQSRTKHVNLRGSWQELGNVLYVQQHLCVNKLSFWRNGYWKNFSDVKAVEPTCQYYLCYIWQSVAK